MLLVLADTIVTLTGEAELSVGLFGQPVSIAPDIRYEVTPKLSLGLVHSRYGITNMRTSAGGGYCIRGNIVCDERYDTAGIEARYKLAYVDVTGGLFLLDVDGIDYALKLAARVEHRVSRLTFHATPTLLIPEQTWLPVGVAANPVGDLILDVTTGLTSRFDEIGDYEIPLVFSLEYAYRHFAPGASFAWPRLAGGREQPDNRASLYGTDYRIVQLWFRVTW